MKLKNIIWILLAASAALTTSCYESKMDWKDPYNHPSTSELPLELQEKIALYDAINTYSEAKIGVAIDFGLYINDADYRAVVNANFDEVVAGNEMKPGSLMSGSGAFNWGNTDTTIEALQTAGLTVYGHTLVWYQQAPAGYLNSLIAPQVIPGEEGTNLVKNGGFETGDLTGWTALNVGAGIEASTEAKLSGEWGIKATSSADSDSHWKLQFRADAIPVQANKTYVLSFWVKSNNTGTGRISFPDPNPVMAPNSVGELAPNQYPYMDWDGTGAKEAFDTSGAWKEIRVEVIPATDQLVLCFDLGKLPGVTYFIDHVSVIDPTAPIGEVNLMPNGDFETGDMAGWSVQNAGDGIEVREEAKRTGQWGLYAKANSASNDYWKLQFRNDAITLDPAKTYIMSFWIKGDMNAPGAGRISFPDKIMTPNEAGEPTANEYPWLDWDGTGAAAAFNVTTSWRQISFEIVPSIAEQKFSFDVGMVPDVTLYIDDVKVVDRDAAPAIVNLLSNGDFETGPNGEPDAQNAALDWVPDWTLKNNPTGIFISSDAKYQGTYGLQATSTSASNSDWNLQFNRTVEGVDPNKNYTISFMVKSNVAGKGRLSFPGDGIRTTVDGTMNNYPYMDWEGTGSEVRDFATSPSWMAIAVSFWPMSTTLSIDFDFGQLPDVTYYIDEVKLFETPAEPEPAAAAPIVARAAEQIIIEKTPEEKRAILEPVLINYITTVADHYKGKIAAWDVVNEPMNEGGTVRIGEEDLKATSTFHWAYYLGEGYAATAFKTARAADPDAKLFINDYGLESTNSAKLDGLISYMDRIEAAGATIDGIGTQMHLNINSHWEASITFDEVTGQRIESETFLARKKAIADMFIKMAATGKLVKVTELDVAIDASSSAGTGPGVDSPITPTTQQLQLQAELFEYVAKMFGQHVPAAQQYGITVWGVSDHPQQHVYWLPGDAPFLFDSAYGRKWAYKSFCDGLYGSDVSADWTYGELLEAEQ